MKTIYYLFHGIFEAHVVERHRFSSVGDLNTTYTLLPNRKTLGFRKDNLNRKLNSLRITKS